MVTAGVLAAWYGPDLKRSPLAFYLLFARTLTASVQVVGVYLVFARLIVSALAAAGRLWRAYALGVAGYGLGLLASALLDLPAGAAVVLALVGVAVLAGRLARASEGKLRLRRELQRVNVGAGALVVFRQAAAGARFALITG